MRELVFTTLILVAALATKAQTQEAVIELGDTLYFEQCTSTDYTYIDYYQKTRFEEDKFLADTATGINYYKGFFDTGDFDVHRMPCSMKGSYGIVKYMMQLKLEKIGAQVVFIAEIEPGKKAAYVLELAFTSGEVRWSPKLR
jgi:hypothetical protein